MLQGKMEKDDILLRLQVTEAAQEDDDLIILYFVTYNFLSR